MALVIRKFETTCRVPRRNRIAADVVDQFARGRFAADLAAHLGPSLAHQPAVVRIRRLTVRVVISASELNEASLSRAWTVAFGQALFRALAYPNGTGPVEVFRAESKASFIAGAIRELLDGQTSTWHYEEFREAVSLGETQGALALFLQRPDLCAEILLELQKTETVEKLLTRLDDLALERLFAILAFPRNPESSPLAIDDLIRCGKLVLQHPPQRLAALRSRAFALKIFLRARAANELPLSPRAIFHVANALAILLSADVSWLESIADVDPTAAHAPAATVSLLQTLATEVRSAQQSLRLDQLQQILGDLRGALKLPPVDALSRKSRVVSTEWSGLFFLVGFLERLGWVRAWRRLPQFQAAGVSPLLLGLALTIVGRFEHAPENLDPGIALFSGYLEEPDLPHVRSVFQFPVEARVGVLRAALGKEDGAESWQTTFEALGHILLRRLTEAIPGFRRSSPAGIVRTFIQRRGRARIDEQQIVVEPEPSAFHVVLHIADLDAAVPAVNWLGGRRLEFAIEDL